MYVVYSVHISLDHKRHEAEAKIIGITQTKDEAYLLAIKKNTVIWNGIVLQPVVVNLVR